MANCETTVDESPTRLRLDRLGDQLHSSLPVLLGPVGSIGELRVLPSSSNVADDPSKILIKNVQAQPIAVVLCSNTFAPKLVERGVKLADASRRLIGERLGSVVLVPILTGEIDGLSFAVLPWHPPLATSRWRWLLQCRLLRPRVLGWLREATRVAAETHREVGLPHDFKDPLVYMKQHESVSDEVRSGVRAALERLEMGAWRPSHTFDHNDLWKRNLLRAPSPVQPSTSIYPFVVIDWLGANPRGYGMYDLIRLADSLRLERTGLRKEIEVHCSALNCELIDARGHLLAALGRLGMNIECFPTDVYVKLVEFCWQMLLWAQGDVRQRPA